MVDRFRRHLWSPTRNAIDAMEPGAVKTFPPEQYFNCHTSVMRSNHAYEGTREYSMTGYWKSERITVRRIR